MATNCGRCSGTFSGPAYYDRRGVLVKFYSCKACGRTEHIVVASKERLHRIMYGVMMDYRGEPGRDRANVPVSLKDVNRKSYPFVGRREEYGD